MRRRPKGREDRARRQTVWPHATIGVPAGDKRKCNVKNANDIYGAGGGGIEDAALPPWKRKRLRRK